MEQVESSSPIVTIASDKFADKTAEISFISSDKILFKIHKDHLDVTSEGFSPPTTADFSEHVHLSEDAATLELLFSFVYPHRIPSLSSIEFQQLSLLAEAAEKYQVYPAMDLCLVYMREAKQKYPLKVFIYAARHGYEKLASSIAPNILQEKLETVVSVIPNSYVVAWIQYYERWSQVAQNALTTHASRIDQSNMQLSDFAAVTAKLTGSLGSLQNIKAVFTASGGSSREMKKWRKLVQKDIDVIPEFFEFLSIPKEGPEKVRENTPDVDNEQDQEGKDSTPTTPDSEGSPFVDIIFQDPGADIMYRSSDGASFRIHERNVRLSASALPSQQLPESTSSPDPVILDEDSDTLNDLLRYLYPVKRPDLAGWDIKYIADLAFAAEKYRILSAIAVGNHYMRRSLDSHPDIVFKYAAVHNYGDLMDAAAPKMIERSLKAILKEIPENVLRSWMRYYDRWSSIARRALRAPSKWSRGPGCRSCADEPNSSTLEIIYMLGEGPASLSDLEKLFDRSPCCLRQESRWESWKTSLQEKIAAIPAFTTFLPQDKESAGSRNDSDED